ncbi:MAG: hypothetical protein RJQ21_19670 [Rhodospirillales bacterium]
MLKKREYQFEVQAQRDGRWYTIQAEEDERKAVSFAEAHLPSATGTILRVTKTRVFENGELGSDFVVWEKEIAAKAEAPVTVVPIDSAPMCETLADLERFEARRCATRLLRKYLDKRYVTATELMHSEREFKRLRDADSLMPSGVSRVAGIQARDAGTDARKRTDDLYKLIDQQFNRLREAGAMKVPSLQVGSVAEAWDRAAKYLGPEQQFFHFGVMLAKHLAGGNGWDAKLDKLLEIKGQSGLPEPVDNLLGEMIAEVLDGASVLQDLLGTQPDLVSALNCLSDLAVGSLKVDPVRQPTLDQLNKAFKGSGMDLAREILTLRIGREIGGRNALTRVGGDEDITALTGIAKRLVDGDGRFVGGADMADAIASRYSRKFDDLGAPGAARQLARGMTEMFPTPGGRITFLCALTSAPFGHRLAAEIVEILTLLIMKPQNINNFTHFKHPVPKKLKDVSAIRTATQEASLRDKEKRVYRDQIDKLTAEYVESEEVLGRIDSADMPLIKRLRGILSLQLSGLLPEGPALDAVRKRVIAHLTGGAGLEGALGELPEAERPAYRRDLKSMLTRAGFPA